VEAGENLYLTGYSLKKLWRCVGGEVKRKNFDLSTDKISGTRKDFFES